VIGVVVGTSITYVQPSTSTTSSSTSSTAVIVVPTTASPTSTISSSRTCTSGFFTCPASLGGGCCQSGRECATGASCLDPDTSTSTEAPSAPVRPTGESTSSGASPTASDDICPTGYYVCSAYYPTGCCRVGRDCQTTGSCAPIPTETIINSNGVTIAAPSGAGVATTAPPQGGSCPSAWYSCPANRGGNCCPEGYSCGEQCTATSGTSVAGKVAPSTATIPSIISIWALFSVAFAVGTAMVLL
jgi:hypothetical protein